MTGRRSARRLSASATSMAVRVDGTNGSLHSRVPRVHANPFMNESEKITTEAKDDNFYLTMTDEEVNKLSGELYNILSPYCTVAWQRLYTKFSQKTMAHAFRLTNVVSPDAVREFQEVEEATSSWENKVKKLESEYGESLSYTMKTAVVTGMMPASIQDFVHTNVDDTTRHQAVVDNLRSWVEEQARGVEWTCPHKRWRGARRAVGGGDRRLGGNGRQGAGRRNVPSLRPCSKDEVRATLCHKDQSRWRLCVQKHTEGKPFASPPHTW